VPPAIDGRRRRRGGATFGTKPGDRAPGRSGAGVIRPPVRTISIRPTAACNRGGRIVGVGDAVGDYTVADNEKNAVVFTTPSGERLRVPGHTTAPEEASR
jgi:hypothetical protein